MKLRPIIAKKKAYELKPGDLIMVEANDNGPHYGAFREVYDGYLVTTGGNRRMYHQTFLYNVYGKN